MEELQGELKENKEGRCEAYWAQSEPEVSYLPGAVCFSCLFPLFPQYNAVRLLKSKSNLSKEKFSKKARSQMNSASASLKLSGEPPFFFYSPANTEVEATKEHSAAMVLLRVEAQLTEVSQTTWTMNVVLLWHHAQKPDREDPKLCCLERLLHP